MKTGHFQTEIARHIHVHESAISRELIRNRGLKGYLPKQAPLLALSRRKEAALRIGDLTHRGGFEKVQDFQCTNNPPTAIVACEDFITLDEMSAPQESGRVAGVDIAIMSFDDTPASAYSNPPLTTVHQPVYKIGWMVCAMLVNLIEGISLENSILC